MSRWPLIRHIRYAWGRFQVYRWARACYGYGLGLGYPNSSDIEHLNAIWKGEA